MPVRYASLVILLLFLTGCALTPEEKFARFMTAGKKFLSQREYSRAVVEFRNATQLRPKDADAAYHLALAYFRAGSLQLSYQTLRKAVDLDPNHKQARLQLAAMMAVSGSKQAAWQALQLVKESAEAVLNSREGLDTLAFIEIQTKQWDNAAGHLRQSIERFPESLEAPLMLAGLLIAQRESAEAEQVLRQAEPLARQPAEKIAIGRYWALLGRLTHTEDLVLQALKMDPKFGPALSDLATLRLRAGKHDEAEKIYRQLAKHPDANYRPLLGIYLASQKRWTEAIPAFEALHRENKQNRDWRTLLVSALIEAGRREQARKLLDEALKRNRQDLAALLQRAGLLLKENELEAAEADLNQLLHLDKTSATVQLYRARLEAARGNWAAQRQHLEEALRLRPALLEARLELADALLRRRRAAKAALEVLENAPPSQQRAYSLQLARAHALFLTGNGNGAWLAVQDLKSRAKTPQLMLLEAAIQLRNKRPLETRQTLQELLRMDPENTRALELLADTYVSGDRPEAGLKVIEEHVARFPQSARLHFFLGQASMAMGRLAQARKAYEKAKQLDPKPPFAELALAQIDLKENKPQAAKARLEAILKMQPHNAWALFLLGNVEQVLGQNTEAAEHYRRVIELDPESALARNNYAYVMAEHLNRPQEALPHIQRAKELEPDNPAINDTLGWTLYRMGHYRQAVAHLEASVKQAPLAASKYHLAMALEKAGDSNAALRYLMEASAQDPKLVSRLRDLERRRLATASLP
ncbi:MAG: tetratricopeptide repeat protein [Bryobacteraceae bacterium]|nr:tetratricopeptide repeat protein [Bryobacteraceae bacterium]MDW8378247.1 tetratricopeptide repeat protein [Bryobacterales bacterium]